MIIAPHKQRNKYGLRYLLQKLKVIVLDTDALIMDDISQLWSFFLKMTNSQAIGLVENLSDWYLFNTGTSQRIVWPELLVHWNSPFKTRVINRYAVLLRYYDNTRDIDGNIFRSNIIHCHPTSKQVHSTLEEVSEYDGNDDGCNEIRHARWITYRTLLHVRPYNFTATLKNVILTTQFSMDRLMHFNVLLQYWSGPVSAAVYVTDSEFSLLTHFFDETLGNRTNIALHAVYKEGAYYPINYLRNVALNSSNDASFVFLTDVDFIPGSGLHEMLYEKLVITNSTGKRAFVVLAFEYVGGGVPVSWKTDYEPYIAVKRSGLPPYDQRFVGFGWNKVSHVMSLNAAGYEFTILPDAFIIHHPHVPSFEMVGYCLLPKYRKCLKALKGEFVRDLFREQRKNRISKFSGYKPNNYSILETA
ncbi:unnamed protein product [Litomosoides sigmodontis]|uniref:Uncharacterized protein n=1 Tax=Litomosoides sigmodontis TaxID=42156 RepID=A0A3P6T263_LITSI|nr:unnamed protein product [Litomosoides sigmodontis]